MPDSDEAFKCPDCNKVYKTRTSLTRHSRNHAPGAAKQYTCETCGVVFARRDILNRHVVNGHCGKKGADGKGAGRCHTACENCRRSRVRCDGEEPCSACVERKKECKYPKTTGRVSWLTRVGKAERDSTGGGGGAEGGAPEVDREAPHASGASRLDRAECSNPHRMQSATESSSLGGRVDFSLHDANGTPARLGQQQHTPHLPRNTGTDSSSSALQTGPRHDTLTPSNGTHPHHGGTGVELLRREPLPTQLLNTPRLAHQHLQGMHSQFSGGYRAVHSGHTPTSHPHPGYPYDGPLHENPHAPSQPLHAKFQHKEQVRLAPAPNELHGTETPLGQPSNGLAANSTDSQNTSAVNGNVESEQASQARRLTTSKMETGHEPPLETAPEVHHVSWPWLHERSFMGAKPTPRCRANERTNSPLDSSIERHSSTPESLGSPSEMDASYRDTITPLANVIESLVAYAANTAFSPEETPARRRYWETTSIQLHEIFYLHGDRSICEPKRTLYRFAKAFLERFNVLWPLIGFEQLDPDTNHPVLFLVVTSIGAMFMPPLQKQYGALMHVRLRRLLCASLYDLEGPSDDEMIWLAQARLLTQIASLYFGQHQGFSYSQHLAAITIAQMRRMDFFREAIPDITSHIWRPPEVELARWQYAETRRRLALGILRTDAYNSVLLSTRPLLTSEEVKLTFPRPDRLWLNEDALDLQGQLQACRTADEAILPMPLSDLVRIFLDRDEAKPDLTTVGYELSLFGLQEWVWRFSHDTELYVRLTGRCLDRTKIDVPRTLPPRDMKELRSDYVRLTHALEAWHDSLNRAVARGDFGNHRDTLMCCMLLYRLTKLRMCSPLEDLHHVSYRAAETPTIDANIFRKVHAWMRSPFATEAAKQAWDIKSTIEDELRRPPAERARFNFLAFCSLHHSAVVLWTFAGVNQAKTAVDAFSPPYEDVEAFIKACANMFSQLSPLGGLSFESAARRLHNYRFPQYLPQYHEAVK